MTPSSVARVSIVGGLLTVLLVSFIALGNWQMQRRVWKLDLIERVERGQTLPPVAAPLQAGADDEYRRVLAQGEYLHERETCVQALTVRGPGYWIVTPLRSTDGRVILINRGFVDAQHCAAATRTEGQIGGPVNVSGRLRLSEPGGGFLRDNDPAADRWYSRDVPAMAASRDLDPARVAPYFIDADTSVDGGPLAGLTVLQFRNHHLGYAFTWYGLAGLVGLALAMIVRREWRARRATIHG